MKCDGCGKASTEYAVRSKDSAVLCPECSAKEIELEMQRTGRAVLYLVRDEAAETMELLAGNRRPAKRYVVTDWFGVLRFPVVAWAEGSHNIAGKRTTVWFHDRDGCGWYGVVYGHNSELCHCRRMNQRKETERR